jgi:hypothetical protein
MSQMPIGVGDADAQARFMANNREFLLEYAELRRVLERVFLRALRTPPQEEVDVLLALPSTDPAVVAFEDRSWLTG